VSDLEVGEPSARVLVANTVIGQPWWSVIRCRAPQWGRSRQAITRIPSGQPTGDHAIELADAAGVTAPPHERTRPVTVM